MGLYLKFYRYLPFFVLTFCLILSHFRDFPTFLKICISPRWLRLFPPPLPRKISWPITYLLLVRSFVSTDYLLLFSSVAGGLPSSAGRCVRRAGGGADQRALPAACCRRTAAAPVRLWTVLTLFYLAQVIYDSKMKFSHSSWENIITGFSAIVTTDFENTCSSQRCHCCGHYSLSELSVE